MMRTLFGLSVFSLAAVPWVMAATDAPATAGPTVVVAPEISWSPERPGEGRLFRVRVASDEASPVMGVHGQVAGEELHFSRLGNGAFESLAAVPVGAGSAVEGTFRIVYQGGGEEQITQSIPVERADYSHEALTVAPRYGSPPSAEDQARLNRDRAMAAEASRNAHRTPRVWSDTVVMPRDGRVTSGFGNGRIFNGQVSSRHMGLDLQGLRGDTVVAATRGVVELVEPFLLAGNIVYLNHGAGLLSAYFHLSEQLVSVGDTVEAGEPVGLVGATGRVTGPHLHWVVRYGTTSVDPRSLLDVFGSTDATR